MSFPFLHIVQRSLTELQGEGRVKPRWNEVESIEDMGLVIRRAAHYIYEEESKDFGLLKLEGGNNSQGFSPNIILSKEGSAWVLLTMAGGMIQVRDDEPAYAEDLLPKWTQPTWELAGLEDPKKLEESYPENPLDTPQVVQRLQEIIELLEAQAERASAFQTDLIKNSRYNTDLIIDRINKLESDAEEKLRQFLVLWQQHNSGEAPEHPSEPPPQLTLLMLRLLGSRPDLIEKKEGEK